MRVVVIGNVSVRGSERREMGEGREGPNGTVPEDGLNGLRDVQGR